MSCTTGGALLSVNTLDSAFANFQGSSVVTLSLENIYKQRSYLDFESGGERLVVRVLEHFQGSAESDVCFSILMLLIVKQGQVVVTTDQYQAVGTGRRLCFLAGFQKHSAGYSIIAVFEGSGANRDVV